ncbi:MAG TPA: hypothetical protein VGS78_07475 [Candidatus Sulfotelmatobacter sp.]|nr:hypothetical protein [Candidatus Sulfotelmatobacter sp.]
MRLVYYSLANFPDQSREGQWIQSIRSLRAYSRSIPVCLLLFNGASEELIREAERQDVHVRSLGNYTEFLQRAHPRGSILALYPTFHKFLALNNLPLQSVSQLLYLDCDTFFFRDVNHLFERHTADDWYAREEPGSLRSHFAYDPKHVDETLLQYIARCEGLHYVSPFNSGVCLLNQGIWHKLNELRQAFLNTVWRLLCGRELSGHLFNLHDPQIHPAVIDAMTESDRSNALPYPSANEWIIEQIALWLTLGRLPDSSFGTFSPAEAPQGGEYENIRESGDRCVLSHYFSGGEEWFFSCVARIEDDARPRKSRPQSPRRKKGARR